MASTFLFKGGLVCTVDPSNPKAEALIARDGEIIYVGSEKGAAELVSGGDNVTEVDLAGGVLLPGFIDAHDHYAMGAVVKVGVDLNGISEPSLIAAKISEYALANPNMDVIRGFGWIPTYFPDNSPTRTLLDSAVSDRPAFIISYDGHDSWFNTACMEHCGISAETPDPAPGKQYYVRDEKGVPTGHAVEGEPTLYILACIGAFGENWLKEAQSLTLYKAPSWGVTSYFEAGILVGDNAAAEAVYQSYIKRDEEGELPVRCVGSVWTREPSDDPAEVVEVLKDWNARLKSKHVEITQQKMWADGTAFSGGALLLEPFLDSEDGDLGKMTFSEEHIERQIELTQLAGFDMHL
jgi:predicted amidohydrolase YtcJ